MEKPPVQARSRATMERLIRVGRQMLAEDTLDLGVNDISRRAKCSVGSFYARFSGKRDFLHRLHRELMDEWSTLVRESLERATQQSLEQGLGDFMDSLGTWSVKYRGALNRFDDWGRSDSRFHQRQELAAQHAISALTDHLESRRIDSAGAKAEDYFHLCWGAVGYGMRFPSGDNQSRLRLRLARLLAHDADT